MQVSWKHIAIAAAILLILGAAIGGGITYAIMGGRGSGERAEELEADLERVRAERDAARESGRQAQRDVTALEDELSELRSDYQRTARQLADARNRASDAEDRARRNRERAQEAEQRLADLADQGGKALEAGLAIERGLRELNQPLRSVVDGIDQYLTPNGTQTPGMEDGGD